MKLSKIILALILFLTMFSTGCQNSSLRGEEQVIRIAGSTSVWPVSEALARQFQLRHPGVKVFVQEGDSTLGVRAVVHHLVEIGAVSRRPSAGEEKSLEFHLLGYDRLQVITSRSNPVRQLTLPQLQGIFAGQISNWRQVGGADAPVHLVVREAGSGTAQVFGEMIMQGRSVSPRALVMSSAGAVVASVGGDPNAIGYVASTYHNPEVKALLVTEQDGAPLSLTRPLYYVTQPAPGGLVRQFLDYARSPAGQQIIRAAMRD
ncbi:phosphate ABC transporter substrate-binding protein [Desulfurispora thermophila]|uniref:phosphate ABC transporter substrate-binding protein n=1 Tax=Desulfurispora thermophila TaxID=265470 RepID=UPI0003613F58|nr:phosphate ABC transporter substrate-binding protein [Desulfurispora thermophila]